MSNHPSERWRTASGATFPYKPDTQPSTQVCSYAKLQGGGFGVRGWNLAEHQEVIAIAQSGREKTLHVRAILWTGEDGRCLATVKELPTGTGGGRSRARMRKRRGVERRVPENAPEAKVCGRCGHWPPDFAGTTHRCHMECSCPTCGELFYGQEETPPELPPPTACYTCGHTKSECSLDCACARCGEIHWGLS